MRSFNKAIAYIFHPVFLPALMAAYMFFVSTNPAFAIKDGKPLHWFFNIANTTLVYPLLLTFLLWRLKFIDSMQMKTQKERYVPLIASQLFYFWVFWVFHTSLKANDWIQIFLLGNFITAVITFLITITEKVSLHTAAFSSLFMYALLLNISTGFKDVPLLILSAILLALIPYARFSIGAHSKRQLLIGFCAGALASFLAFLFI